MDAEGDFVVAWQSSPQDGSGTGIYAQRYTAIHSKPVIPRPTPPKLIVNTGGLLDQIRRLLDDLDGGMPIDTWNARAGNHRLTGKEGEPSS
jgi:hypothetical protein